MYLVLYVIGCKFRSNEFVALRTSILICLSIAMLLDTDGRMGVAKSTRSHA
jgi:hypothetical protein